MKRSLALFVVVSALAACKSGIGSKCQTNDDCQSGLTCSNTMGVCVGNENDKPQDAEVVDTSIDAPTDAATDAAVDAAHD